uniref:Uncharacterized protein n=1 Tax=Cucumis melo TaxID=3656 RepID=A0A9I9EJ00_CUCME
MGVPLLAPSACYRVDRRIGWVPLRPPPFVSNSKLHGPHLHLSLLFYSQSSLCDLIMVVFNY